MKYLKFFMPVLLVSFISACSATRSPITKLPTSYALPGTSTAVVGIALDKKGYPLETVKEIVLKPGQKVIFAGPDRFLISFKNRKSPANIIKYESGNGVVTVTIPKDILDNPQFIEEFRKNNFLRFDYAINVNGRELDPPIIIKRDE